MLRYNSEIAIEFYCYALETLREKIPGVGSDGYEVLEELYDGDKLTELVFEFSCFDPFDQEHVIDPVKINVQIDDDDEVSIRLACSHFKVCEASEYDPENEELGTDADFDRYAVEVQNGRGYYDDYGKYCPYGEADDA